MTLEWINPAALAGLATIAGPVVVHLLRRQRARRVPFPTVQFLVSTRAAAARLKRPSDLALLTLRIAIVAAAAIAAAQPFIVTDWRRAAWEQRIARALVIDTSVSMAPAGSRLETAAAAERQGSWAVREIRTTHPGAGLKEASVALRAVDAGRLEIVVLSDFQRGSLSSADIAAVPPQVGLRFVPIDSTRPSGTFSGWREFRPDGPPLEQQITLDGSRTRVALTPTMPSARVPRILSKPEQADAVASMRRVVAAAGAPELPADRGLTVIFPGVPVPAAGPPRADWMVRALVMAREDVRLQAAGSAHTGDPGAALPAPWVPLVATPSAQPLVAVAAIGQDLAAHVSADPGDLLAAAVLRALLFAIAKPFAWPEREVERISAVQLSGWARGPTPGAAGRPAPASPGDARWCWGIALLLLAFETVVRRSAPVAREEQARAA